MCESITLRRALGIALVVLGCQAAGTAVAQDMTGATREHVRKSTVMVLMKMPGTGGGSSGTGEFINANGLLMTNNHVVDPNHGKSKEERSRDYQKVTLPRYEVIVESGTKDEHVLKAKVLHQTETGDMALLQVEDEDGKPPVIEDYLQFAPPGSLEEGRKVWIFGFPGGLMRGKEVAITAGLITNLWKATSGAVNYVEADATAHPGNSGGPMVDVDGQLIGIVTHLQVKERQKDQSGAVPFHFVQQFIRTAFVEGRISKKADVLPFIDIFTDQKGIVTFPTYPREDDRAFVNFTSGTIQSGEPTESVFHIKTTLGEFDVPLDRAAYLMVQGDVSTFIMDGGDTLSFPTERREISFKFGTSEKKVKLQDIDAIAFARPKDPVIFPDGEGTWFVADGTRLGLSAIKGNVAVGGGTFELSDLVAVEDRKKNKKRFRTVHGERVVGEVGDAPISANTPWSAEPIEFTLTGVKKATARPVNWTYINADGRRLVDRFEYYEDDLKEIAVLLDSPNWERAKPLLEKADEANSRSREGRRILSLFHGVEKLRGGDFQEAQSEFKRVRSKSYDVGWVAEGYLMLLERYPDGNYGGGSLADPDAVWRASTEAANQIMENVEKELARIDDLPYRRQQKLLEDMEEQLDTANRLRIGVAQGMLMTVLEKAFYTHQDGWRELAGDYNQAVEKHNNQRTRSAQQKWVRKLRACENKLDNCEEEIRRIYERLNEESVGFIVDPPKFDRTK